MRTDTQRIVGELEQRSGFPVHVVANSGLGVMSKVTTSPDATGSYIIEYRPDAQHKDYLIAFECGHVLRLLALPPSERYQFVLTEEAATWGAGLVRGFLERAQQRPLAPQVIEGLTSQLVSGLFTQLRSIPVGMRVDTWLSEEYPGLRDEQSGALAAQQREALSCLSPQVRSLAPDEIVSASIVLNAAYALFCDRLLGTTTCEVPYAASGFSQHGRALIGLFDTLPADPSSDCALVDSWARELGLDGKYRWRTIAPVGAGDRRRTQ